MPSYQDRLLNQENFYFAFKKLKGYLRQSNEWYNPVELEVYEAGLSATIHRLINEIKNGLYSPKPIQPLPFPKKNKEDEVRMRPYFRIHLDDQLIWLAISNVVGELVDSQMPFWSYGNRLYRPLWYEKNDDGANKLQKGAYSNASPWFYRKWNQSWPLFRRHISIAIKVMGHNSDFNPNLLTDEKEQALLEENIVNNRAEVPYLSKEFWSEHPVKKLYWAGLDFERFFPSIDAQLVLVNLKRILGDRTDVSLILSLAEKMLTFPLDNCWTDDNLRKQYQLNNNYFRGLPTGLYAAGFLANLALYEVDQDLTHWIRDRRTVALFKYVDDQVVVSTSPEELLSFLNDYQALIKAKASTIQFQPTKIAPDGVFDIDTSGKFSFKNQGKHDLGNELDIDFPEPLMTHTLKKMSDLNESDFDLTDDSGLDKAQDDLEHFLMADFPDTEMRRDTRMSFAAMKLCQLAKHIRPNFSKLDPFFHQNRELAIQEFNGDLSNCSSKEKEVAIREWQLNDFQRQFGIELKKVERRQLRIFTLLLKACKENPDKVKLWRRTLEFCYYTGHPGIEDVFFEMDDVEVHKESKAYLKSYGMLILQNCLFRAHHDLAGDTVSFWRSYTSWRFMLAVQAFASKLATLPKNHSDYPFLEETLFNFNVVSELIFQVMNSVPNVLLVIQNLSSPVFAPPLYWIENRGSVDQFNFSHYSRLESHLWFLYNNLDKRFSAALWQENVTSLSAKEAVSWSILSLHPQNIPVEIFDRFIQKIDSATDTEVVLSERSNFKLATGIVYDIFSSNPTIKEAFLDRYPALMIAFDEKREKLNLFEWLRNVNELTAGKRWTDPRLSEWTMLEIVRQIAQAYISKIQNKQQVIFGLNLTSFHPANFLMPVKWSTTQDSLTWIQWSRRAGSAEKISIVDDDALIDDFRYFPSQEQWKTSFRWLFGGGETDLIVSLTVLLVQLTARTFIWPATASKQVFVDELFSYALRTIESEPLSSETRMLIGAILSKDNVSVMYGEEPITLSDGRYLKNLTDLNIEIAKIQKVLKRSQFSMRDNMPRQLTIIDIDAMNMSTHKFFER